MISARDFKNIIDHPPLKVVVDTWVDTMVQSTRIQLLENIRHCVSDVPAAHDALSRISAWHNLMKIAEAADIPLSSIDEFLQIARTQIKHSTRVSENIATLSWLESITSICSFFHTYIIQDPHYKLLDHPNAALTVTDFVKNMQVALESHYLHIEEAEESLKKLLAFSGSSTPPAELHQYFEELGNLDIDEEVYERMVTKHPYLQVYSYFIRLFIELHQNLASYILNNRGSLTSEAFAYIDDIQSFVEVSISKLLSSKNALTLLLEQNVE